MTGPATLDEFERAISEALDRVPACADDLTEVDVLSKLALGALRKARAERDDLQAEVTAAENEADRQRTRRKTVEFERDANRSRAEKAEAEVERLRALIKSDLDYDIHPHGRGDIDD